MCWHTTTHKKKYDLIKGYKAARTVDENNFKSVRWIIELLLNIILITGDNRVIIKSNMCQKNREKCSVVQVDAFKLLLLPDQQLNLQ